jgi:hypothetical protein
MRGFYMFCTALVVVCALFEFFISIVILATAGPILVSAFCWAVGLFELWMAFELKGLLT